MLIEYKGAIKLKGSLLFFETIPGISFGEKVIVKSKNKELLGKIVGLEGKTTLIEILGEPYNFNLEDITVRFSGELFKLGVSENMLGRILNAYGEPVDEFGKIIPEKYLEISGYPYNPAKRMYPKDFVHTGISAIDGLNTVVKGQKLPIFSVSGVPIDDFVSQIVRQIKVSKNRSATIFGAIGIKYETINFLIENIVSGGNFQNTAIFLSLADEPAVNKILVPRSALTFAEYLAFELNYDVVVVLYDMTNYGDSLREISAKKEEIPSRKGYPGYMYSDLASIYERAGLIKNKIGSITQIPVLTMPDDDITHPIPDLTGYITEGQIVLDRDLHQKGIYPPINVLPSLSRLMNKGIKKLHQRWANQIYSSYAKGKRAEMLATIIGESEIGEVERKYLEFSRKFEKTFLKQGKFEDRELEETLKIGWDILKILPIEELTKLKEEDIKENIL